MKGIATTVCAAALFAVSATGAHALVTPDTMGDTTAEQVFRGYNGNNESLAGTLADMGITRPGGGPLVIGDVLLGEDPSTSDQLQFQRFLVTGEDEVIKITYMGLGIAAYKSIFSVYTYGMNQDPMTAILDVEPLFVQNVDTPGLEVFFTVPKDHYFGFTVNANGFVASAGNFFTENFRNSDNSLQFNRVTDHFLMFDTTAGLLIGVEDLNYSNGKLGDQDYEDLIVAFVTKGDGTSLFGDPGATPEPAGLGLIAAAGAVTTLLRRRRA